MRHDIDQLRRAVGHILGVLNLRPLHNYSPPDSLPGSRTSSEPPAFKSQQLRHTKSQSSTTLYQEPRTHPVFLKAEDDHPHPADENDGQPLFSSPMGSLFEVTRMRGHMSLQSEAMEPDFISKGLISPADAQELFTA